MRYFFNLFEQALIMARIATLHALHNCSSIFGTRDVRRTNPENYLSEELHSKERGRGDMISLHSYCLNFFISPPSLFHSLSLYLSLSLSSVAFSSLFSLPGTLNRQEIFSPI